MFNAQATVIENNGKYFLQVISDKGTSYFVEIKESSAERIADAEDIQCMPLNDESDTENIADNTY